ncbi:MalY/PatB family protein [Chryseobacterium sp.]|uniref:MalY/PatB family protein n=1 Tax=Chryseobacterium sp. TaxID=1871047 RepID=UPI00289948E9|nr:MalY/PatB family protein [Chryseobacterium sp.]
MKYNFDEIIDRRNTNSVKWDFFPEDVLPMWVADMDFKIAPEIQNAITEKANSGLMGYQFLSSEFKISAKKWLKKYHQFEVSEEEILPVPGMLLGISAIIRKYLEEGDKIILQSPVYDHFFDTVKNSGAELICNQLTYNKNEYQIDFKDLEEKASDPKTKFLIFCNPHNPVGKVWTENDLRKIAEIASKNNVIVISDEIHSDLVFDGFKHIPFGKIANDYDLISFTLGSPCKTFNLSGLSSSYIISDQKNELKKVQQTLQKQETEWMNPFSATAFIAAYSLGEEWMIEVKKYIYENYLFTKSYIEEKIPEIKIVQPEATYLLWLDCSDLNLKSDILEERLINEAKIKLNSGTRYGDAGESFMRMNIACPREILVEGLSRIEKFVNSLK